MRESASLPKLSSFLWSGSFGYLCSECDCDGQVENVRGAFDLARKVREDHKLQDDADGASCAATDVTVFLEVNIENGLMRRMRDDYLAQPPKHGRVHLVEQGERERLWCGTLTSRPERRAVLPRTDDPAKATCGTCLNYLRRSQEIAAIREAYRQSEDATLAP